MDGRPRLFLSSFTPQEVSDFIKKIPGFSEDVLTSIVSHKIDREVLLALNKEYLHEIVTSLL